VAPLLRLHDDDAIVVEGVSTPADTKKQLEQRSSVILMFGRRLAKWRPMPHPECVAEEVRPGRAFGGSLHAF
jgi:hypothetical protein